MKLWALLYEGCETKGRDSLQGLFHSRLAAMTYAQEECDALAEENDRPPKNLAWNIDGGSCRADASHCPCGCGEYFVRECEVKA